MRWDDNENVFLKLFIWIVFWMWVTNGTSTLNEQMQRNIQIWNDVCRNTKNEKYNEMRSKHDTVSLNRWQINGYSHSGKKKKPFSLTALFCCFLQKIKSTWNVLNVTSAKYHNNQMVLGSPHFAGQMKMYTNSESTTDVTVSQLHHVLYSRGGYGDVSPKHPVIISDNHHRRGASHWHNQELEQQ